MSARSDSVYGVTNRGFTTHEPTGFHKARTTRYSIVPSRREGDYSVLPLFGRDTSVTAMLDSCVTDHPLYGHGALVTPLTTTAVDFLTFESSLSMVSAGALDTPRCR